MIRFVMRFEEREGFLVFANGFGHIAHLLVHQPEVFDNVATLVFAHDLEGPAEVEFGFREFLEVDLHEAEIIKVALLGALIGEVGVLGSFDHGLEDGLGFGVAAGGNININQVLLDREGIRVMFVANPVDMAEGLLEVAFGAGRLLEFEVVAGLGLEDVGEIPVAGLGI